ncbi:hypothetical protein C9374_001401 [Naegleria lovaniensis]|uniref:Uncharacterized protein n=1 Tax=Naegleria lovaniensis TaxID=51637 RepID=A0AA88KS72_NAELO|nr:uncharacterized protein C9374_001401 [Naegleria lovaniensis]KAG2387807.1 hypothetical protein C9374_001401 [Naegleria lovaniensis]
MHMAQQNAAQNGTTTNSSQQQPQQQVLGIPPYPVFFAPIPASQIGQQPFVYNPSSLPTSQPTPTSPMQTDSAPSPSTAFPIFVDPYHLYGSSFVPKPITMLENTDDGFTDLVPNSSQPSLSSVDSKTKLEDLDVNNNGIVEEVAGILPQSNDPTSKHLTTNDIHAATTDNLEIFDDIDYFDNDVDRNNNNNSDFSLFTWQDSPLLDKKKPTTTRPVSNRASNDDEIIDLITSEASLLTERAKEQQISNRQNGNVVANSNTNNTGSSSTSSSTQDHQSLSLTTPEEINYVISQAPENSLMKQKLGDILKQIWQTQENQSKEINELKQLVSELKRMIIS